MNVYSQKMIPRLLGKALLLIWLEGFATGLAFLAFIAYRGSIFTMVMVIVIDLLFQIALLYPLNIYLNKLFHFIDGSIGEFKVNTILDQLWHNGVRSVDDVMLDPRSNIDHVAIAKTGVWVIETKYIGGKITYSNGTLLQNEKPFSKKYLQQAYAEADKIKEYLYLKGISEIPVRPILVFAEKFSGVQLGFKPIHNVFVVSSLGIKKLITDPSFGSHLSARQIDQLVKIFTKVKQKP